MADEPQEPACAGRTTGRPETPSRTSRPEPRRSARGARDDPQRGLDEGPDLAGDRELVPQARPARRGAQPRDVRGRGRQRHHDLLLHPGPHPHARRHGLRGRGGRLAVVHGAVRQLRDGHGRGPRQGAGRRAAQDAHRDLREPGDRRRRQAGAGGRAAQGPRRDRLGRRDHPRRRRGDRGHRLGRRVGHHRRVGAGDPRERRRPQRRDRRHQGALRPDQGARSPRTPARASSTA